MRITAPERESRLSQLVVGDVMRRALLSHHQGTPLGSAIATLVKHKADGLLVVDDDGLPVGVVTKTEVMGGYYGELPLATPLAAIMGAPVIGCSPAESLKNALLAMQRHHIHRLFVIDPDSGRAVGSLSYPDIVGILYRYCCRCELSLRAKLPEGEVPARLTAGEAMHRQVISGRAESAIEEIIGLLASYRIGALLLVEGDGRPAGVLSKTDLALAYRRGVGLSAPVASIMQRQVRSCIQSDGLESVIRQMIFAEVSRLFVTGDEGDGIVGIVTLTDAARMHSGSCRACTNSRIIPKA